MIRKTSGFVSYISTVSNISTTKPEVFRLRLHPAIWATASTHFVSDAYGNMYAPLLPLLIPRLDLSLQTIGVLAMTYQLASSVSQLGFGTLADRWRPRVLLMGGPVLSVPPSLVRPGPILWSGRLVSIRPNP